jgi:flagellar hook assembly protein FlgD
VFVDLNNPDYTSLTGPITQQEKEQYLLGYDPTFEAWIDPWSLTNEADTLTKTVDFTWSGMNNAGKLVKNGVYTMKLVVDDSQFDPADGVVYEDVTKTITVKTASIAGRLLDVSSVPVTGAKIIGSSPDFWGETYSYNDGTFELAGLKLSGTYNLVIQTDKYSVETVLSVNANSDLGNLFLKTGTKLAGIIEVPNPPLAGELRDQWSGYPLNDLWGGVDVYRIDGAQSGGSARKDVKVHLTNAVISKTTVYYEMYLSPGKYMVNVKIPGYVTSIQELSVGQTGITQNFQMTRSSVLKGWVVLPQGYQPGNMSGNISVNVTGESFDHKNYTWGQARFDSNTVLTGKTSAEFYLDNMVPSTSYYVRFESIGNFAKKQIVVYVSSGTNVMPAPVRLDQGVTITGMMNILNNIVPFINAWRFDAARNAYRVTVNARSLDDYTIYGTDIYVSTSFAQLPHGSSYTIRGVAAGKYEIQIDLPEVDVQPGETVDRTIVVSSATNSVQGVTITLRSPTAALFGRINIPAGMQVDTTKMKVAVIVPDKGDPRYVNVDSNGYFFAKDLQSGTAIVWGNEYKEMPAVGTSLTSLFGKPTGTAGTFMTWVNLQSGTTALLNVDLKQGSTVNITITASTTTLKKIFDQETSTRVTLGVFIPRKIARVQSLFLNKLAADMEVNDLKKDPDNQYRLLPKLLSITGDLSDNDWTDGNLSFTVNGLEPGIYYVYPAVGMPMWGWLDGDWFVSAVRHDYASTPAERAIILVPKETKQVGFSVGTGVSLKGTVARTQSGTDEKVDVILRDMDTNMIVQSIKLVFFSTSNMMNNSFEFKNMSPGKYSLLVWSLSYKAVSRMVELGADDNDIGTIQLSKGANITGRLTDEDGKSVTDSVLIECFTYPFVEGSYRNSDMAGLNISTVIPGNFTFPNLPAGNYFVKVRPKLFTKVSYVVSVKSGITVPDSQVDVDLGVITLKKGTTISGKVRYPVLLPAANISMKAYPVDVQKRAENTVETVTDINGVYSLTGIDPEISFWEVRANVRSDDPSKEVTVENKFGESVIMNVKPGSTGVNFILGLANARVTGTVVVPAGNSLVLPFKIPGVNSDDFPAALVLVQSAADLVSGDPMAGAKGLTGPEGRFSVDGLTSGRYVMKIFAKGFATYIKTVDIKSGENSQGYITLTAGLKVSGSIRTNDGKRISTDDATSIVATSRDLKNIVFGSLNFNQESKEIDSYEIVGLSTGVPYHVVLVEPQTNKVYVDPAVVNMDGSTATVVKDIVYRDYPPRFAARVFKTRLAKILLPFIFTNVRLVDLLNLPNEVDVFFVYAAVTEPLQESDIWMVVSTGTASAGKILTLEKGGLKENRKEIVFAYLKGVNEAKFKIRFVGHSTKGVKGEDEMEFAALEDGRNEKIVNPAIGGSVSVGGTESVDGIGSLSGQDNSSIDIPAGAIQDEVAVTSGTKVTISKVSGNTMTASNLKPGWLPFRYKPATVLPGEFASSVYDVQVRLISGPLATLAQGQTVTLKVQLASGTVQADADNLKLYCYNSGSQQWVAESITSDIDWTNLLYSADISHMSQFAVFNVSASSAVGWNGTFKSYFYPNPFKPGTDTAGYVAYYLPAGNNSLEVTVKIYTVSGELVKTLRSAVNKTPGYKYTVEPDATWDGTTENKEKVASGIYLYHIKAGDYSEVKKIAVVQ